jgi:tRNA (guanine10-N2)-methyltransferase
LKNVNTEKLNPILDKKEDFRFKVEVLGRKASMKEQTEIIKTYAIYNFEGDVNLKNPKIIFSVMENLGNNECYFGREAACHFTAGTERELFYARYDLKKRPYLGPTTLSDELAFLMAN